jgi:hypothetical protein
VNHSLSVSSGLVSGVEPGHGFDIGGGTTANRHIVQNGQTMIKS